MAEVERHASKESAWFACDGKVYDATPFLKEHPGELALCGVDCPALRTSTLPPPLTWTRWDDRQSVARPRPPALHSPLLPACPRPPPPPHPAGGADSILLVAGTDATDEFNAIHSNKVGHRLQAQRWAAG